MSQRSNKVGRDCKSIKKVLNFKELSSLASHIHAFLKPLLCYFKCICSVYTNKWSNKPTRKWVESEIRNTWQTDRIGTLQNYLSLSLTKLPTTSRERHSWDQKAHKIASPNSESLYVVNKCCWSKTTAATETNVWPPRSIS